jgi:hypothetical protein
LPIPVSPVMTSAADSPEPAERKAQILPTSASRPIGSESTFHPRIGCNTPAGIREARTGPHDDLWRLPTPPAGSRQADGPRIRRGHRHPRRVIRAATGPCGQTRPFRPDTTPVRWRSMRRGGGCNIRGLGGVFMPNRQRPRRTPWCYASRRPNSLPSSGKT